MKNYVITTLLILVTSMLTAQDAYKDVLYTSETMLKYSDEIGLSDGQTAKIKKLYNQSTTTFKTLKEELNQAQDSLKELLKNTQVDERASLKKLDRVNDLEDRLKYVRLQMLIRIKNEISDTQQQKLESALQKDDNSFSFETTDKKDTRIVIRGNATLDRKQPLYVLVYPDQEGEFRTTSAKVSNIDTERIESVNVLKGQAAKSLYGEDGENGVIVIKMKKGQ